MGTLLCCRSSWEISQLLPITVEAMVPEVQHFPLLAARPVEVDVRWEDGPWDSFIPRNAGSFHKPFHSHEEVRQIGSDILSHLLLTKKSALDPVPTVWIHKHFLLQQCSLHQEKNRQVSQAKGFEGFLSLTSRQGRSREWERSGIREPCRLQQQAVWGGVGRRRRKP